MAGFRATYLHGLFTVELPFRRCACKNSYTVRGDGLEVETV